MYVYTEPYLYRQIHAIYCNKNRTKTSVYANVWGWHKKTTEKASLQWAHTFSQYNATNGMTGTIKSSRLRKFHAFYIVVVYNAYVCMCRQKNMLGVLSLAHESRSRVYIWCCCWDAWSGNIKTTPAGHVLTEFNIVCSTLVAWKCTCKIHIKRKLLWW